MIRESLSDRWRQRADQLEPYAPAAATAFRACADEFDAQARHDAEAVLTIHEAAVASGYSPEHIRHQIAAGALKNVGKKGRPRVRAGDLPRKAARAGSVYDAGADALSLVRRVGP